MRLGALAPAALLLQSCAVAPPGAATEPIVAGVDDDAHAAVVRVIYRPTMGVCTGTVIAADDTGRGWVLTAGHCVASPTLPTLRLRPAAQIDVVVGADASGGVTLPVVARHLHPGYDRDRIVVEGARDAWSVGMTNDVALLEVSGVDAALRGAAIPLLDEGPAPLVVGDALIALGFGSTSLDGSGLAMRRQRVDVAIAEAVTALRSGTPLLAIDQTGGRGGICLGDSGGPLVRATPDGPRVAAVISGVQFGDASAPCGDHGVATRVSGIAAWARGVIAGDPPAPPAGCYACAATVGSTGASCHDTAGAAALSDLARCLQTTWRDDCFAANPAGADAYDRYWACADAACPACDAGDRAEMLCRYTQDGGGACDACIEAACCREVSDCQHDGDCNVCFGTLSADRAACTASALYSRARGCLDRECGAACGSFVARLPAAGEEPPPDGGASADAGSLSDAGPSDAGAAAADATIAPPAADDGGCAASGRAPGKVSSAIALAALALLTARAVRSTGTRRRWRRGAPVRARRRSG